MMLLPYKLTKTDCRVIEIEIRRLTDMAEVRTEAVLLSTPDKTALTHLAHLFGGASDELLRCKKAVRSMLSQETEE
jgi:hypothetical protein